MQDKILRPNFPLIAFVLSISPLCKHSLIDEKKPGQPDYCAYGALLRYGGLPVEKIKALEVIGHDYEPSMNAWEEAHSVMRREYGLTEEYDDVITGGNDTAQKGNEARDVVQMVQEHYVDLVNEQREEDNLESLTAQELLGAQYVRV